MTAEEYTAAKAALANADTEIAALDQQARDSIEKAREYNLLTRTLRNGVTEINRKVHPLREQVAAYDQEQRRQLVERIKAENEAKAKAAEESELQKAHARIAELEAATAGK